MKQGWNKSGHIQGVALEPFIGSGGPLKDPKWPKMVILELIRGSDGSELAEQCGIKVEQVRAHTGQCNGTVPLVRGAYWGPQKDPKRAQNGPK